ncbi:DUF5991 domain-containing protein [Bacteroidota bacterium]
MKKFPNLDEYSNDELIIIVYSEKELWQKEAIIYAKYLLEKHGISESKAKERLAQLDDIAEEFWRQEMEARKVESYSVLEIILMLLIWPRYIFRDWGLRKDGYIRKSKQRLISIGLPACFWIIFAFYANATADKRYQERVNDINRVAYLDSLEKSKIDWSGKYQFEDTEVQQSSKYILWTLDISKTNKGHIGKLEINNNNLSQTIQLSCVLTDVGIEFYPDTIYNVLGKTEIAYYDNLFTFAEKDSSLLTYWFKLKPFELTDYVNGKIYFKKINNP